MIRLDRPKADIALLLVSGRQASDAQSHKIPECCLERAGLGRPRTSREKIFLNSFFCDRLAREGESLLAENPHPLQSQGSGMVAKMLFSDEENIAVAGTTGSRPCNIKYFHCSPTSSFNCLGNAGASGHGVLRTM
jgi:hypothetical protein